MGRLETAVRGWDVCRLHLGVGWWLLSLQVRRVLSHHCHLRPFLLQAA